VARTVPPNLTDSPLIKVAMLPISLFVSALFSPLQGFFFLPQMKESEDTPQTNFLPSFARKIWEDLPLFSQRSHPPEKRSRVEDFPHPSLLRTLEGSAFFLAVPSFWVLFFTVPLLRQIALLLKFQRHLF